MQIITHQEARHLIQHRADQALDLHKKEILNAHLKDCVECADYANEIHDTEVMLQKTLRKHWNASPVPLQVRDIKARSISSGRLLENLATRSAVVGVTLLFFIFVYWQFTSPSYGSYSPMPIGISPIPTPSLPLTSTQNSFVDCEMIRYEVQPQDTVEGLARQFSTSEEKIMDLNGLKAEAAPLPKMLIIPACELTPTSTTHPPPSATTNTPSLEAITYTPG
jgi:hypothetical protein